MAQIASWLKRIDEKAHVVLSAPCIAKKAEVALTKSGEYIDYALTFEEMQAMFSARGINVREMEKSELDNASYFGASLRAAAACGGSAPGAGGAKGAGGEVCAQRNFLQRAAGVPHGAF